MTGTALDYISAKGIQYKIRKQGNELVLQECPFCGDRKFHFYIRAEEDGLFFCHKCQERGNLITLQKHLGDYGPQNGREEHRNGNGSYSSKPQGSIKEAFSPKERQNNVVDGKFILQAHERLLGDPDGIAYLESRKITLQTIRAFKLGLQVDRDGIRWLTIPHYSNGKPVNVKSRTIPPAKKSFRRIPGCLSVLFNLDGVHGCHEIFLTEGEFDCMTLVQNRFPNAVAATGGAGSFDPSWVDALNPFERIYIVYDPDPPGQKGAREVARRLGYDRCFNVVLPDNQDVNEFFQDPKNDAAQFATLVDEARQFDVAGIISFEDGFEKFLGEIENPKQETAGLITPWPSVNKRIKTGFKPGELIILSAPPKIGKSTWALQIAANNALEGVPSLFFCLEMRPMKIIEKIIQCHAKTAKLDPEKVENVREAFSSRPLYLGFCYKKPELDGVIETIKAAVHRYGLRLIVFDHLHFLCRSITNQTQEIGLAVQAFKFLAEEMEVPIILIAQPRKIQADSIMTAMDLKDSISIFSDCDHLVILHRKRKARTGAEIQEDMETQDQAFEPVTLVRVEASRYNSGGEALLYYHGEYSRFDELGKG